MCQRLCLSASKFILLQLKTCSKAAECMRVKHALQQPDQDTLIEQPFTPIEH